MEKLNRNQQIERAAQTRSHIIAMLNEAETPIDIIELCERFKKRNTDYSASESWSWFDGLVWRMASDGLIQSILSPENSSHKLYFPNGREMPESRLAASGKRPYAKRSSPGLERCVAALETWKAADEIVASLSHNPALRQHGEAIMDTARKERDAVLAEICKQDAP